MIYLEQDELIIRSIEEKDAKAFDKGFELQGWCKPEAQFIRYFKEQEADERKVFVAEVDKEVAGYVTLIKAEHGPYANKDLQEVCDFNVLIKYQKRGIGNKLMDIAEKVAGETSDCVTLGVGLHPGYGSAQRMYIKRGYVPDGSGVWYNNSQLGQGEPCDNIDDLVLYMCKKL